MTVEVTRLEGESSFITTRLIHWGNKVQCIHREAVNVWFSYAAWRFFASNYECILHLVEKAGSVEKSTLAPDTYLSVGRARNNFQIRIGPGPHRDEWRIIFIEDVITMDLTLHSPSGKGSVDYTEEIREMLNAIK